MTKTGNYLLALGILVHLLIEEGYSIEIKNVFVSDKENYRDVNNNNKKTLSCGKANTIAYYKPYLYAKISGVGKNSYIYGAV